jgi:phenylpropionate dioxygenase-like ring-hydroxylating dioxygenase large terminal subunit
MPKPDLPAPDLPSPVATGEGQGEGTQSVSEPPKALRGQGRRSWNTWPAYDAAELGLREYWYPVAWSGRLGRKAVAVKVLGEDVMLLRDADGTPHALANRCPHRGVPLSLGRQEFPGTWSCWYHGWTYDLGSGAMVACLTDGPDSPLRGKVHVKTYPVEERIGLLWLFMGDGQAPPVEDDIPAELLRQPNARAGRISVRPGNWRLAAENGFDEGHAKFLHRASLWTLMRRMPAYSRTHVEPTEGDWITRKTTAVGMEEIDYPGLGKWPRKDWWRRRGGAPVCSIRLPGCLRIAYPGWTHYEWYVATNAENHRYIQVAAKFSTGLQGLWFKLRYWTYIRWIFHGLFNDEDAIMVETMDIPPERLYRPDVSIIAWRKLCDRPRGHGASAAAEMHEADVAQFDQQAAG